LINCYYKLTLKEFDKTVFAEIFKDDFKSSKNYPSKDMLRSRKFIFLLASILFASVLQAQHPDRKEVDSLKRLLRTAHGIQRIDCLNALCEEYWFPPKINSDTLAGLANVAYKEAAAINYTLGIATSTMILVSPKSIEKISALEKNICGKL
jgi:hypothetical protein